MKKSITNLWIRIANLEIAKYVIVISLVYISCLRGKVEHAEFLVVSDDCVLPASGNIISWKHF